MHAWQIGEIFGNLEFNRGGKLRERMKMLDKIEMPKIKCMVQRKARIYSNLYKYFMKAIYKISKFLGQKSEKKMTVLNQY